MSRTLFAAAVLGLSAFPAVAGCVGQCYQQSYAPPTYETTTERVLVRAPRTYAITTPAQYKTVHETVQVSPGGRYWTVKLDHHGRKVGCWVTTPPRFATVPRTVLVQAAQVVPYAEPAQYGFRSHTVQTHPGYKTWVPLPSDHQGGFAHRASYGASVGMGVPRSRYEGRRNGRTEKVGYGSSATFGTEPAGGADMDDGESN